MTWHYLSLMTDTLYSKWAIIPHTTFWLWIHFPFTVLQARRGRHPFETSGHLWGPHCAIDHVHGVRQGHLRQRCCHRRRWRILTYMQHPCMNIFPLISKLLFSLYRFIRSWINVIYLSETSFLSDTENPCHICDYACSIISVIWYVYIGSTVL